MNGALTRKGTCLEHVVHQTTKAKLKILDGMNLFMFVTSNLVAD